MRVDPNYSTQLLQGLSQTSSAEQTLTNELSSGLRITSLADDPVAAAGNVTLASSISGLDSFVKSSTSEQSMMQASDNALGEVVTQVNSAISLAVSAGDGTLSADNVKSIADQVTQIRDSVLSLANTSYAGQYVFSGSQGGTQPFTLDPTTDPAAVTYNGDDATQTTNTPDGQKIQSNLPGSSVFTSSSGSLLGTLNQLVSDLNAVSAGTGTTASVEADSTALTSALGVVSTQRAVLDSGLSQLTSSTTYASSQEAVYKSAQSTLLSADPATVATDLKNAELQQQALYGVASALEGAQDLFSYMH